ncbi:MAG: hypothetical protein ACRYFS_17375 [Janthinobacterium lividum]
MKLRTLGISLLSLSIFPLSSSNSASATPTHLAEPATKSDVPVPAVDDGKWRTFTSTAGRFSILVPASPVPRTLTLSPVKEVLQQFICRSSDGIYIVQYADRPVKEVQILGAEKLLSLADDAFLKSSHSILIGKQRLILDGSSGHEIAVTRYNGSKEFQRTYLVGNRGYTLLEPVMHFVGLFGLICPWRG